MYCQALVLVRDFAAARVMVLFGKMNLEHLAPAPAPPAGLLSCTTHCQLYKWQARTGVEKI
jgi:hypothetical protein